ncbi:MAG: C1 family peptidase [Oscillospiraceae bacterium]
MKNCKKLLAALLVLSLMLSVFSGCGAKPAPEAAPVETAAPVAEAQGKADNLIAALEAEMIRLLKLGGDEMNMYGGNLREVDFSVLPAAYDLRDLGVVGPIRSQGNWGTCWSFAITAAAEISILSELGITYEDFVQMAGQPMDLSERHLAWFANSALPKAEDYPEGQYPYPELINQAGEGIYTPDEEAGKPNARFSDGGWLAFGTGMYSAGIGPVMESQYPYTANDGTDSTAADWSVPEEARFQIAVELENSYILPSPALVNEDGEYVYNAYGTYAIKNELLHGRAVTIAYHADQAMDPEARKNMVIDMIRAMGFDESREDLEKVVGLINLGELTAADLNDKQLRICFEIVLKEQQGLTVEEAKEMAATVSAEQIRTTFENMGQPQEAPAEDVEALRAEAAKLGLDYDEFMKEIQESQEADKASYINLKTFAQYTDTHNAGVNHAVTIVGWDDNYSAENFLEDKRPPADGAWIVRNSWGEDYGDGGYFYLSFYDQTISIPESFDFVTSYKAGSPTKVSMVGMDYMVTGSYPTVRSEEVISYGNVFTMDPGLDVLRYISVLCGTGDAEITADVYLLNENAIVPSDGILLDRVVTDLRYGGYYRIPLSHEFHIPEGSRIGVVVTQRSANGEDVQYSLPYTIATTQAYMDIYNQLMPTETMMSKKYNVALIGQGESWVYQNGQWYDWADVIADLSNANEKAQYVTYDNLGIKLYAYSMEELETLHNFDETVSYHGAEMKICSDCSYSIVTP